MCRPQGVFNRSAGHRGIRHETDLRPVEGGYPGQSRLMTTMEDRQEGLLTSTCVHYWLNTRHISQDFSAKELFATKATRLSHLRVCQYSQTLTTDFQGTEEELKLG